MQTAPQHAAVAAAIMHAAPPDAVWAVRTAPRQQRLDIPEMVRQEASSGIRNPAVRVLDENSGELVDALRSRTPRFKPWAFAEGSQTDQIGEPLNRLTTLTGRRSRKTQKDPTIQNTSP